MFDGACRKVVDVYRRNKRPQYSQPFPAVHAEYREKYGGNQYSSHRAPTVERVEQAHGRLLIVKGTCLHNGAAEHFDQSASHGVYDHTAQDSGKRIRQKIRQKRKTDQPGRGADFGSHDGYTVSDPVHKFCTEEVHQKLGKEKTGGNESDIA